MKKLGEKDGVSDVEPFGRVLNKVEMIHLAIDKELKNPQSNLFQLIKQLVRIRTIAKDMLSIISLDQSSWMKQPSLNFLPDSKVVRDIQWTKALNQIFQKNFEQYSGLSWQYFGTVEGVHRQFPGKWTSIE